MTSINENPSTFVLVHEGQPCFCLAVEPPQDTESLFEPLAELVEHLEQCLGGKIPWFDRWDNPSVQPLPRVVLRLDPASTFSREGFGITADPDLLVIAATTPIGLRHGVYYFLETAFGVRWLWPGKIGTVIPRVQNAHWPPGKTCYEPAWAWRRLGVEGAFWNESSPSLAELKFGKVGPATLRDLHAWQRHNRLGGLNIADGHRWAQICSPLVYGQSHPEYFALVAGRRDCEFHNGKHGNQLCGSNPEVIALVAEHVKNQFRARPDLDGFSIAANDGLGFCQCESCIAIDRWAGENQHTQDAFARATQEGVTELDRGAADQPAITDRMLLFANRVAEQVEREFPGKLLLVLIYSVYRQPPRRVRLHTNVIAQFCTMSFSHGNTAVAEKETATLEKLGEYTEKRGIYDYFVNGSNGAMPRGFARTIYDCLSRYYRRGGRFFATQAGLDFATGGFAYYLAAKCLWDPATEYQAVLDDYCRSGFAEGWEAVRTYLTAFEDRWQQLGELKASGLRMEAQAVRLYPTQWRTDRRNDLDQAFCAVEKNPEVRLRVEFLREGLDFLDRLVDACQPAVDLLAQGLPDNPESLQAFLSRHTFLPPQRELIGQALSARKGLLEWVDAHRDGFWIAAMWFDYQVRMRGGLLGRWMDLLESASGSGTP